MGRHYAPDPPPPRPARSGPARWVRQPGPVALVVVLALIVACGIRAVVDMRDDGGTGTATGVTLGGPVAPSPQPPLSGPPSSDVPTGGPSVAPTGLVGSPAAGGTGAPSADSTSSPGRTPTMRPPATAGGAVPVSASVTGTYRTDNAWSDGFTGSVNLGNAAGTAANWQVTLTFPAAVTGNTQFWSNAAAQPTRSVSGRTWTFTGTTTIPAGGSVVLGFQFAKDASAQDAASFAPSSCTVNGRACGAR